MSIRGLPLFSKVMFYYLSFCRVNLIVMLSGISMSNANVFTLESFDLGTFLNIDDVITFCILQYQ